MPQSSKHPCNKIGCGNLTRVKYCDKHMLDTDNKTNYQHTKTSSQRGYGYKWQKLRVTILKRDNYLCQECLSNGHTTEAYAVDHKTPKSKGGTDSTDNLQSLCRTCHDHKTATVDSKG